MSNIFQDKQSKKILIIVGSVIVGITLLFIVRAICVSAAASHAYGKAVKEYNKAYDKAKKDMDRTLKQYGY